MKSDNTLDIFTNSLKEIYPSDYSVILKGLSKPKPTTFRINKSKADSTNVLNELQKAGYQIQKGPLENSFIVIKYPKKGYISDTKPYTKGEVYIQELSSMLPPILLNPQEGENILDISAAPGSKTTQIADLANNKANIIAIEKHPIRIKTLFHNIELQGSKNVNIIQGNGIKFDKRNPQYIELFDKAIVDAPCSTEGRFILSDPKSYKYWNIKKRRDMSKVQKGLLISAYRMLKPGGTLVYSTCTFGIEENELVLEWLLEKYEEAKIEKIDLPIKNIKPGIIHYKEKTLNKSIRNARRILPNEFFTGFFVAMIRKSI